MRWVGSGEGEGEQGADEGVDGARGIAHGWLCCFYLKNAESVGLESGSSVCQVVMKSLLPFLVESLGGRNDVKVSTAAAVNFTASESKRRSFFVFFSFRAWTPCPDDSPSVVCCESQQAAS